MGFSYCQREAKNRLFQDLEDWAYALAYVHVFTCADDPKGLSIKSYYC